MNVKRSSLIALSVLLLAASGVNRDGVGSACAQPTGPKPLQQKTPPRGRLVAQPGYVFEMRLPGRLVVRNRTTGSIQDVNARCNCDLITENLPGGPVSKGGGECPYVITPDAVRCGGCETTCSLTSTVPPPKAGAPPATSGFIYLQ